FFQIGQRRIKNVVSLLYLGFIFALGQILVVRFIIVVDAFCQNRSTQVNVGLQVIGVNGQCFLVRSDGLVVLIKGCLGNAQVILQGFIVGRLLGLLLSRFLYCFLVACHEVQFDVVCGDLSIFRVFLRGDLRIFQCIGRVAELQVQT